MGISGWCSDVGSSDLEALSLGASDTLAKPGRGSFSGRFAEILTDRILTLGQQSAPLPVLRALPQAEPKRPPTIDTDQLLECIAVAASAGGIPAFGNFLTHLDPRIAAPILLTQHLPAAFLAFYPRPRSEERRVGKECVRQVRSRGSP